MSPGWSFHSLPSLERIFLMGFNSNSSTEDLQKSFFFFPVVQDKISAHGWCDGNKDGRVINNGDEVTFPEESNPCGIQAPPASTILTGWELNPGRAALPKGMSTQDGESAKFTIF